MLILSDLIVRDPSKIDLDPFYAQTLEQTVTFSLKSYSSVCNQGIWELQVLTIFFGLKLHTNVHLYCTFGVISKKA